MAQDLVSYIIEQLRAGYDVNTIRSYLASYGYSPEVVEDAIRKAYAQAYKKQGFAAGDFFSRIKNNVWLMALLIIMIILIGAVLAYFLIFNEKGPGAAKPDTNIPGMVSTPSITPTSKQTASTTTKPTSTAKQTPTKTITASSTTSSASSSPKTTVTPSTTASSAKKSCGDGIQNNGEIGIDCGGPCETSCRNKPFDPGGVGYNTDEIPGFKPAGPASFDPTTYDTSTKTGLELLNEIKRTAAIDGKKAVNDCAKLRDALQDECYSSVAEITNTSAYCTKVKAESNKDACYITFALAGDFAMCDKMLSEVVRNSCYQLRDLSKQGISATGKAYEVYALLAAYRHSRIG